MGEPGKNISAPIAALYLLKKAQENRIEQSNRQKRFSGCCATFSFLRTRRKWCARCLSRLARLWRQCRFIQLSFLPRPESLGTDWVRDAATTIYLTKSTDIAARTLGDETIIMSTVDSTIFMLNPIGTAIWNAADGKTPLSRIVEERVCAEFDVTDEQASADAKEFVDELANTAYFRL